MPEETDEQREEMAMEKVANALNPFPKSMRERILQRSLEREAERKDDD